MNIVIERLNKAHLTLATELLKELYLELGEEEESIQYLKEELILELLESGRTEIYIAEKDGITAGILTLSEGQSIYAGGNYGLVDEMYIKPEFRSNQIGGDLIKKIMEIGKAKNWKRVDVTAPTEERWQRTISFYEKAGFVFTGPKYKLKIY